MKYKTKDQGFSLIEILIAVLILSVGILAVSKLQGQLIRGSSDANQRTVATSIAQKKIDDLKSFTKLKSDNTWAQAIALTGTLPQTEVAYTHIAGNSNLTTYTETGGLISPSASITVGPTVYSLNWEVEEYWHSAALSAPTTTEPSPSPDKSDFKKVTVTVGWNNETGEAQSISLDTVVYSYAPALTALSDNSQDGGEPPSASYTPELAPDVIDINVNTGQDRQTSKALPDAVSTGQGSNTIVSFEVVTYSPDGDYDYVADRQEEFVTVDCHCTLSGSTASAYPPGHARWVGTDRSDFVGTPIPKATATQINNANAAEELCQTCCKDHHDVTNSLVKYVEGTNSGDHPHYKSDGVEAGADDEYIESCRLKRIDGILRVFQDWDLKDILVMNRSDLTEGSDLLGEYVTYQQDFILDLVASAGTGETKPTSSTDINTTVGGSQQLEARGIYIDNVYDEYGILSAEYISYIQDSNNTDQLEKIPFAEVNLTLLANWSSLDSDTVTVTNEGVATVVDPVNDYYGTYSRGWIEGISEGITSVTAFMETGNDGLTQITPQGASYLNDAITINVGASASAINITIDFTIDYPSPSTVTPSDRPTPIITITGDTNSTCNPVSNGSTYTCPVTAPWTGTIQVTVDGACSGSSSIYEPSTALTADTTHTFSSFSCSI